MLSALILTMIAANPRELGDIHFSRDLDAAFIAAKNQDKPILILFDEVPGCSTCTSYGETVLKNSLLVEAAETLFVPVAIYNNLGGADRAALERYKEPSWNNPVVRIVDASGTMLAPRVNGDYTAAGLARAMVTALEAAGKAVPEYLRIALEEAEADVHGTERVVFSMFCFWSGEACLGQIEGVVATRTGFAEGHEVVEAEIDTARLTREVLLAKAKSCGEPQPKGIGIRPSQKDDQYNLKASRYAKLRMTPLQATRANAMLAKGQDPANVFSPRQRSND